jgi:hypothetical protein
MYDILKIKIPITVKSDNVWLGGSEGIESSSRPNSAGV